MDEIKTIRDLKALIANIPDDVKICRWTRGYICVISNSVAFGTFNAHLPYNAPPYEDTRHDVVEGEQVLMVSI